MNNKFKIRKQELQKEKDVIKKEKDVDDEIDMKKLIEKYEKTIKANILSCIKLNQKRFDKLREITNQLPMIKDLDKLKVLEEKKKKIEREIISSYANAKNKNGSLKFPILPLLPAPRNWSSNIKQMWYNYWPTCEFIGNSHMNYGVWLKTVVDPHHESEANGTYPYYMDHDYKVKYMNIDIPMTIMNRKSWASKFNINFKPL